MSIELHNKLLYFLGVCMPLVYLLFFFFRELLVVGGESVKAQITALDNGVSHLHSSPHSLMLAPLLLGGYCCGHTRSSR